MCNQWVPALPALRFTRRKTATKMNVQHQRLAWSPSGVRFRLVQSLAVEANNRGNDPFSKRQDTEAQLAERSLIRDSAARSPVKRVQSLSPKWIASSVIGPNGVSAANLVIMGSEKESRILQQWLLVVVHRAALKHKRKSRAWTNRVYQQLK